jgi:hypothetical protein
MPRRSPQAYEADAQYYEVEKGIFFQFWASKMIQSSFAASD